MVQLPEPTRQQSGRTIAEIGKERIRRAIARLKSERADQPDLNDWDLPEDLGFRVFRLDRSNYKAWRDFEGGDAAGLQTLFDRFESKLQQFGNLTRAAIELNLDARKAVTAPALPTLPTIDFADAAVGCPKLVVQEARHQSVLGCVRMF